MAEELPEEALPDGDELFEHHRIVADKGQSLLRVDKFLFNLLPILPLDGGHVAGALYESVKRFIARVRGKPDPGPVDTARLLPVAYVVAAVLLGVGLVVIWADLVKPITLS